MISINSAVVAMLQSYRSVAGQAHGTLRGHERWALAAMRISRASSAPTSKMKWVRCARLRASRLSPCNSGRQGAQEQKSKASYVAATGVLQGGLTSEQDASSRQASAPEHGQTHEYYE
jgi:hypothetical protein